MDNHSYPQQAAPKPKKGGKWLRKILVVLLIAAAAFFVWKKCSGGGGEGDTSKYDNLVLDDKYLSTPEKVIEPTPENSPGNPQFIDVSFTEEEYRKSPTVSGAISVDTSAIIFSEQGVMVDVRDYNLHNPNDTLVVQTLPVKTDPTYGHELHTYNISLTSGQDKFGTEVEVTLPIHNGPGALQNVLWLNHDTGKWEEVFYTVADDGKSCTAYVDHFSDYATEELSREQLEKFYNDMRNYVDGSVFVEYDPTGTATQAMKKVAVIPTNEFEKFLRKTSKNSEAIYDILNQGGGVPTGSGTTEALDMFGLGNDISSTIATVTGSIGLISDATGAVLGLALTALGWWILDQREKDMTMRAISPQKVEEENRWSHYFAWVSTVGTVASFAGAVTTGVVATGLSAGALICGWACVAGFAATKVYAINQKYVSAVAPFGTPMTIEEGAYHEYLRLDNWVPLRKLGIKSEVPLNGLGKGWAEAIYAIKEANPNAKSIAEVSDQIKRLYDEYVNIFWTDLPQDVKLIMWKQYIENRAKDIAVSYNRLIPELHGDLPALFKKLRAEAPNIPSDYDEFLRLFSLCRRSGSLILNDQRSVKKESFDDLNFEANFDNNIVRSHQLLYKFHAMEALTQNTNRIIFDVIEKDFHKRAMEARKKIRNEVLPTLNSTLYFYAVDESLKKDETVLHSKYYGYDSVSMKNDPKLLCEMKFKGRRTPLFRAKNDTGAPYCLDLKTSEKEEKVGKCTVFHYLQYGAPDSVDIKAPDYDNLKDIIGHVQLAKAKPYEIPIGSGKTERGFRVPVVFNNDNFDLSQFNGVWVPLELKGKVTEDDYITMIVYLPEDNEFGIYEGRLRSKSSKSGWTEIKYYSFDEKTKTISIDFEKNARKDQNVRPGIALYTLKDNGNLIMRNSGGGWEFFRLTEDDIRPVTITPYKLDPSKLIPLGDTDYY